MRIEKKYLVATEEHVSPTKSAILRAKWKEAFSEENRTLHFQFQQTGGGALPFAVVY